MVSDVQYDRAVDALRLASGDIKQTILAVNQVQHQATLTDAQAWASKASSYLYAIQANVNRALAASEPGP